MQYWINGRATDGIDDEIKMAEDRTIPHYSIFGANSKDKKTSI
jgi:hypothetical protein